VNDNLLIPIQQVVNATGVSSRTLRHYDDIGLLRPAAIGSGGMRLYGQTELTRLQTILVMRELGLPLSDIGRALGDPGAVAPILEQHIELLRLKSRDIEKMISASNTTITNIKKGRHTPLDEMFAGFDHTQYKAEVEERWGAKAFADGDKWWRSMNAEERQRWKHQQDELIGDWRDAAARGIDPTGTEAQALATRQAAWLSSIPGTPGHGTGEVPSTYLLGLADMYVSDERFGANYGGSAGARFVKASLEQWVANRG
jgi:DNA-binding transcriptional MerR regulator